MSNPLINRQQNVGGSFYDFMNRYREFSGNPTEILSRSGVNIPQGMNNPNNIIQYLMNTGKMSQAQYNQLQQIAEQIQNNPMFRQAIKK
jgi:hypothetical protein